MTHRRPNASASVRIVGPPATVDRIVQTLADALPAITPSRAYPSHRATDHVRIYLEVSPE